MKKLSERMKTMAAKKRIRTPAIWTILGDYAKEVERLEEDNEGLRERPAIKISDGDVWLVFPDTLVSIEGICRIGAPGPIVKRNLRKWREALLTSKANGE